MNIIKKIALLLEEKKRKLNESAKPTNSNSDDSLIGLNSANVASLIVTQNLIDDSDERRVRELIDNSSQFNGAGCYGGESDSHSSSYESSCDSSSDSSCSSSCE